MIDLRDHLEALKERGELLTIDKEVDWNLDAAAIAAMSNRTGAQAIHFTKVAGYPKGYTLAANLFAGPGHLYYLYKRWMWSRIAISLELDPRIDYELLIATINDRRAHTIMPVKVTVAPCKEEIQVGDEVNVLKFPFPILHKEDGGRYGTGVFIVKDPDSDWQNWGVYRFMILGRNRLVADFLTEPSLSTDTRAIFEKYCARNRPMPFAIALGGAPAIMIAAAMRLPPGAGEVDAAGGLNLDPINLVKAETSDILVPGDAEIIIEGEVIPDELVEEGPYGTIKGYTRPQPRPVMKVTAITNRKDPILPFIVDGTNGNDTQALISITESAHITRICNEEYGDPLRWVQIPVDWNLGVCIAAIMNPIPGMVFMVARHILAASNLFDKLIVVDWDVHPRSLNMVTMDWMQKVHPIRGHHVLEHYPPAVMPNYGEKEPGEGTARMYIDACWPAWYKPEEKPMPITWESAFPEELRARVLKRWKEEFKIPIEPLVFERHPFFGQQR